MPIYRGCVRLLRHCAVADLPTYFAVPRLEFKHDFQPKYMNQIVFPTYFFWYVSSCSHAALAQFQHVCWTFLFVCLVSSLASKQFQQTDVFDVQTIVEIKHFATFIFHFPASFFWTPKSVIKLGKFQFSSFTQFIIVQIPTNLKWLTISGIKFHSLIFFALFSLFILAFFTIAIFQFFAINAAKN